MAIFQDFRFTWKAKEYLVSSNEVLPLIARVEDVITLAELAHFQMRGTLPVAKISLAFGVMLRYAGAQATDEEVYDDLFGDGETLAKAAALVSTLQVLMIPPRHLQQKGEPGKVPAGANGSSSSLPLTS